MKGIAVFASGSGSNFQAIVDACESGKLHAKVNLLVCDRPGAKAIERADKHGIPTFVFKAKEYPDKEAFETEILKRLEEAKVEFIALAGYMRLIGQTLLSQFEGKMVNIHPSLLPAFPGKDAIGQAIESGVSETGVTVHYVDNGMDTGPIIEQSSVPIDAGDTAEILQQKIHKIEHELYPKVIQNILHTSTEKGEFA
ncbi:phosphoribosylglycinamide formyltransferase [Bacillus sp. Marseille-Q3570]|uniref:phosphoribosylglycinamide formyltransferase n=1 Tax=Bacillus sp. Marseille-Q3570 TaxID=2963522 RepID=UPI0021B78493|nr:phosphoribosylglycinamide formyltransferase [Bacillus sp. Marseille-Q3570]